MGHLTLSHLPQKGKKMKSKTINGTIKLNKSRKNWHEVVFLIIMMAVPVLYGIVYNLYLKFATIRLMFSDKYGTGFGFYWVSWAIREAFTPNSPTIIALKNAFAIMIVFNGLGIPLQIVIAYFFFKKAPMTNLFRTLFYIPSLFSAVILSLVFGFMFDNTIGPITMLLRNLGVEIPLEGLFFAPDTAMPMIFVYIFWYTVGNAAFMITVAMLKIPESITEAARIEGISNFKELIYICVPMVSPVLSVMILTNVTLGFSIYAEVLLLTDPGQSHVYTVAYLINESAKQGKYFESAGRGFVFTVVAIPLVVFVRWFFGKFLPDVSV